ncbi:PEP/pyruvate-binding domain-containing protein [Endozoicomonas sp. 8E]|uniref:PEP/pyruvate-binding domain-containing protein n=1 Tax=Endozoicomonas sp. 8E TaxID=3035692 RepID=UPI0029393BAC|nr:PEP/pyruvate-binding domain-containing protein [Endozoicomonas sp. 8E]WOG25540.1 PEP/pyruvate-binding domain-containing protein [Endozoicomonas sp. 8E]
MEKTQPTISGLAIPTSTHKPNCKKATAFTRSVISANQDFPSCKKDRSDKTVPSCPQLPARDIKLPTTGNRRPASHDLPSLHANNDRAFMGGKGLFLHHMQQAGIPVPPFTVVDTALVARLEQQPFPAKCLLPFLPPINTRSQKSFSLKQLRAIITELPHQQQSEWLKGLSEFIASEDFYQQVKNISAAGDIRHCYFRLRQQANEACIVRSSGVDEDRFGDAQAGRYDSRVHGGDDILKTCLQVLSSAYRPEVCPNGQVKPMALVLQQCIHCRLGGVVISHSTLQDDTIQVEFAPGQPRGAVSGNTGISPHRYRIRRSDDENSQPDRQFTAGDVTTQFVLEKITGEETGEAGYIEQSTSATTDAKDIMLSDEILQKLQQYIEKLEDMFCCPVDVEFGVDGDQQLHVFQCRPVTQLPGSTRFSAPAPAVSIAEGIMVSEGCCSGVALAVTEPVNAEQIPPGAILFANHASDWMLAPDILKRLGGCVFKQGGTNDHVAITLRQAGIPCLLAGCQYSEALRKSSGQQVTLVAGSFAGSPGACLLTGDQSAFWQANSSSSGQDIVSLPASSPEEPPDFTRVDEGFAWLNRQNNRLLDYFRADRLLSHCLGPGRSKAISMSANRSDLLPQLGMEIHVLQDDLQRFITGYKSFLDLAVGPKPGSVVEHFIDELPFLKKQWRYLKDAIDDLYTEVVTPLASKEESPTRRTNFRQWLRDCQTLLDKLQKLNQPGKVCDIHSAHDLIYWLHQRFVTALAPVAKASGQGQITDITVERTLIDVLAQGVPGLLNDNCISVLSKLFVVELDILNMVDAAFVNATLGVHVCTITMLEEAEGGKGRTLRLDISDDFSQYEKNKHLQGKLKRFWFLVQTLRCASIDSSSRPMAISFNQSAGKMIIEYTQINSTPALQKAFVELVNILSGLTSMDISINQPDFSKNTDKWCFETLIKRCQNGLDEPVNNQTFKHCLILDAINDRNAAYWHHEYTFLDYLDSEYKLFFDMANKACHCIEATEDPNTNSELRQIFNAATKHLEPNDATRIIKELLLSMAIASDSPLRDACVELLREDFDLDHDRDLVLLLVRQNPRIFKDIADIFKDDIDIAKTAIEQEGDLLAFASERLRNNTSLVLLAVNNH